MTNKTTQSPESDQVSVEEADLLVHGGEILTVDAAGTLIPGGAVAVRDGEIVAVAEWDPITAPRMITSGISLFPSDHRLTVARYFSHHRLAFNETETAITVDLPDGGSCLAEFDGDDRFISMSMRLQGA